jgi:ankyrin repeat protein
MSRPFRGTLLLFAALALAAALPAAGPGLVSAIKDQNTRAVARLIQAHADVNAKLPDGSTPLAWAAFEDQPGIADLLLKAGAKPNTADDYGESPLTLACANGNGPMVGKLLAAGANATAARWNGETALMIAAHTGSVEAVRLLLAHGAKVDAIESRKGQNALMWAASQGAAPVIDLLLKAGANPNAASKAGFTPLVFAAESGDAKAVSSLAAAGAQIDYAVPAGMNALSIAIALHKPEVASVLVSSGAALTVKDRTGDLPLHLVAQAGDLTLLKEMIARGADVNAKTSAAQTGGRGGRGRGRGGRGGGPAGEQTPLMLAARANHVDIMRALVAAGADPKLTAQDGSTLLMEAAASGHLEAVQYAWELTPDFRAETQARQTVMHAALTASLQSSTQAEICKVVQFLADKGAPVNPRDAAGRTPLQIANTSKLNNVATLLTKLAQSKR